MTTNNNDLLIKLTTFTQKMNISYHTQKTIKSTFLARILLVIDEKKYYGKIK